MSGIFSQNNNYSATSSAGLSQTNTAQRLQNELDLLLNETNESQTGGKRRKQRGGNAANSDERLANEFNILMEELRETGSALPNELLEGGKRKKGSSKKSSKKLLDGGKRKKGSSKKSSKKLLDGGKRKASKKSSKKLLDGGKRKASSKKASKKSSRKQSRELPEAIVRFNKLKREIIDGLGIKGKEIITIASKIAKHYNEATNKNTDEAIKLFKKELGSGKAKELYNSIAKQ